MQPDDSIPELVRLVFGEQARTVYAMADERLLAWAAAFDGWLAQAERYPDRRGLYRHAWAGFLSFCRKPPWEVGQADLQSWVESQLGQGLAAATIDHKLGALSRFYEYAAAHLSAAAQPGPAGDGSGDGSEECSKDGLEFNPLRGFHRPRPGRYSRAVYLSVQEARALLSAIDREATNLGRRDYALVLAHLLTGQGSSRLLHLRWGEICEPGDSGIAFGEGAQSLPAEAPPSPVVCTSTLPSMGEGKGLGKWVRGEARLSLPAAVWEAVLEYLRASGRLEGIRPGDYVFAPLADPLLHPDGRQPADWNPQRPLSRPAFYRTLREYARCAGLRDGLINTHTLRHTAVGLRLEAGDGTQELAAFLGWASTVEVDRYTWRLVESPKPDLFAEGNRPAQTRDRSFGGPPGNQRALKHGFYASRLPPEDFAGVEALPRDSAEAEIDTLRAVIGRTLGLMARDQSGEQALHFLDVLSRAIQRLSRVMLDQRELKGGQSEFSLAVDQAISELTEEMGLKKLFGG